AGARLGGVWEEGVRGGMDRAFGAWGRRSAADAARRVDAALDGYAAAWTAARTDACRATAVRREQSAELLDARMACLDQRLEGARQLTRLLVAADGATVDRSSSAALGLAPIDGCSGANVARRPPRATAMPGPR